MTSDDANANEQTMVEWAGMKYLQIPMTTHEPPTFQHLSQFLALVNDPASQLVYVHCIGGRHRMGVMTAVYRMTQDGWSGDQAFKEMKRYKYGADFLHPEFKKFVYAYQAAPAKAVLAASPSHQRGLVLRGRPMDAEDSSSRPWRHASLPAD